jgi:hypothetical protein
MLSTAVESCPVWSVKTQGCPVQGERVGCRAGRTGLGALKLYLDASALVKRYVAEAGSEVVRRSMSVAGMPDSRSYGGAFGLRGWL